ncbi:NmrA family NAD(P)-binding protein [Phaeobacter sp. C3_T13_0]|uniref:NmrA family NAD(P)-binding protein n=1 Tax=Phaeobacter cretensis TaxID=3342641 RepID=UPI0039BD46FF
MTIKKIPESVLIFGAANHIGSPLAAFLTKEAPQVKLRLVSSKADKVPALQEKFPNAEVIVANYFDAASMDAAVDGIEGMFVNAPPGLDETVVTENLISAVKKSGTIVHLLRTTGLMPEANIHRVPQALREIPGDPFVQHHHAKNLLYASGLPVTIMNFGATFMDNFLTMMAPGIRNDRKLIWNNRKVPYIDPLDIAETAGRLLLSDNAKHIGQFHTLNNGQDLYRYSEVAPIMSEVFGEEITYHGSREDFMAQYSPMMGPFAPALWAFLSYEGANEEVWALNDFVERTIGRKPNSLRNWLADHKEQLLG